MDNKKCIYCGDRELEFMMWEDKIEFRCVNCCGYFSFNKHEIIELMCKLRELEEVKKDIEKIIKEIENNEFIIGNRAWISFFTNKLKFVEKEIKTRNEKLKEGNNETK